MHLALFYIFCVVESINVSYSLAYCSVGYNVVMHFLYVTITVVYFLLDINWVGCTVYKLVSQLIDCLVSLVGFVIDCSFN